MCVEDATDQHGNSQEHITVQARIVDKIEEIDRNDDEISGLPMKILSDCETRNYYELISTLLFLELF